MRQPLVESLESRQLFALNFHAAVPGGLPPGSFLHDCEEVVAARTELRADIVQMRTDQREGRKLLAEDRQAIAAELAKAQEANPDLQEQLKSLRQKLAEDRRVGNREIRQDQKAIQDKRKEFAAAIRTDKRALRQARQSGDESAIEAAKEKLADDRASLEAALKPLQDELKADQQRVKELVAADRADIEDKLVELHPALGPLLDKLEADAKALDEKLTAARAEIQADREALVTAIKECTEEHDDSTPPV